MTAAERKLWRAKWIDRLVSKGIPLFQLAGIADHELWQLKNRHFPVGRITDASRIQPRNPTRL